jgi:hypothetical protein
MGDFMIFESHISPYFSIICSVENKKFHILKHEVDVKLKNYYTS